MIEVCCAIIVNEAGRVLVTQRSATMSMPLKMEFPGGKIEPGESPEDCLIREIKEELDLTVEIISPGPASPYQYPEFSILLLPFLCRIVAGTILLKEHAAYAWMEPSDLLNCDWAEADIPIVHQYLNPSNNTSLLTNK
ncbi:(deoxy)nucleoside triphosphate pyrophosphohydrolase [Pedobacter sp. PLR]|uniref:(deoxy)nucleoside triphosphate pyrophosphohydrolase n=1 Tax=Pedobacter sp. PLR TaxID=2994465 RepID=UPI0022458426|nr:(deoxy)nucleoside triphosphate pyrophosphohydrolase [Pedobacter sp. PLR]MCX2453486.1 (deoxy)nucleoside triphosphate pyrophosphohydrolase [Pedobacter sp. PLR]